MSQNIYFATPQEAEEAFYDAFERGNIESMMSVWSNDKSVVCIHPVGPRLHGFEQIKESWQQIFHSQKGFKFKLTHNQYTQDSLLAIHLVKENIEINGRSRGVMLATNVYQFIEGSWRMVLHHASPEPSSAEVREEMQAPTGSSVH